jgi:hypothetical protein
MASVTIKIDTRSKKSQYLLGLISELSKIDKGISFLDEDTEVLKSIDQSFKELDLVRKGKLKPSPARDILSKL